MVEIAPAAIWQATPQYIPERSSRRRGSTPADARGVGPRTLTGLAILWDLFIHCLAALRADGAQHFYKVSMD
jgi:hypothetical protein